MRKVVRSVVLLASAVALLATLPASAHEDEGGHGPAPAPAPVEGGGHQHGSTDGHLPASQANVELVGRLDTLTNVERGIADVTAFGDYAYLNAFSPECAGQPGAQGTGVHVVDISNPRAPAKVGFLPAEPNSYVGEGVHVIEFTGRRLLLHNNETCDQSRMVTSGFSVWDVTNPLTPAKLGQYGDTTPVFPTQVFHTTHSVQGFVWQGRAYAVAQDNQDLDDVDIFDITPTLGGAPAVLVAEVGFEDWPAAHAPLALGDSVRHHDMQQKVVDGHNLLLVSYWDAGQVLLNIDDPANPVFVADSDFATPDLTGSAVPEGNSHQSYWSQDGRYVISSDEDFAPTRTLCRITDGPAAGPVGCGEYDYTRPLGSSTVEGPTVYGGSGCSTDENANGTADRNEIPPPAALDQIVVFSRGGCFSSDKVRAGEQAGYRFVAVGSSHDDTRGGVVGDTFTCFSRSTPVLGTAHGICIGHRTMHVLFDDPPAFAPPESHAAGGDLPAIGAAGQRLQVQGGAFDGWGHLRLHRGDTLAEIDSYAIPQALDPAYATGFGALTVHEVKTDPRAKANVAYASYYDAGLRVLSFGEDGLREIGHYIAEGGNDFWGVFPVCTGKCARHDRDKGRGAGNEKRPLILVSDRDSGLWIFRYTGKE